MSWEDWIARTKGTSCFVARTFTKIKEVTSTGFVISTWVLCFSFLTYWFVSRDADVDGQLSLREYASSLTTSKLQQFAKLDLNNDGFIVPREYLQATNVSRQ